jgi:hypothetical protein
MQPKTVGPYQNIFLLLIVILLLTSLLPSLYNYFGIDYVTPGTTTKPISKNYLIDTISLFEWFFVVFSVPQYSFIIFFLSAALIDVYFLSKNFQPFLHFLILIFNPFLYSRIMVGQLGMILAYLLAPVYLYYLFNFFKSPDLKSSIKAALAFTLTASFQPQFFAFNILFFMVAMFYNRDKVKAMIKPALILFLFILLLNAYWLQGFFSNTIFSAIDESHERFFAPKYVSGVSTTARVIGMWGFWREAAYITTYRTLPSVLWHILTFMLPVLMILGYMHNPDRKANFFLTIWLIGLLLALGISHTVTEPIFNFLFEHLPFFSGFRDSHKFTALMALGYAYLIPGGIKAIQSYISRIHKRTKPRSYH